MPLPAIERLIALSTAKDVAHPSEGPPIRIDGGITPWTPGAYIEVVPDDALLCPFELRGINIEQVAAGNFRSLILNLYHDGYKFLCSRRFSASTLQGHHIDLPIRTGIMNACTTVYATLTSGIPRDHIWLSFRIIKWEQPPA